MLLPKRLLGLLVSLPLGHRLLLGELLLLILSNLVTNELFGLHHPLSVPLGTSKLIHIHFALFQELKVPTPKLTGADSNKARRRTLSFTPVPRTCDAFIKLFHGLSISEADHLVGSDAVRDVAVSLIVVDEIVRITYFVAAQRLVQGQSVLHGSSPYPVEAGQTA